MLFFYSHQQCLDYMEPKCSSCGTFVPLIVYHWWGTLHIVIMTVLLMRHIMYCSGGLAYHWWGLLHIVCHWLHIVYRWWRLIRIADEPTARVCTTTLLIVCHWWGLTADEPTACYVPGLLHIMYCWWGLVHIVCHWWGLTADEPTVPGLLHIMYCWWGLVHIVCHWWGLTADEPTVPGLLHIMYCWWGRCMVPKNISALKNDLIWILLHSYSYILVQRMIVHFIRLL